MRLSQYEKSSYDVQNLVNSTKVNESFLQNVEEMFELEFDIKMRAQLKYMEVFSKRKRKVGLWDTIRHEYLWTPTTNYYVGTIFLFIFLRRSY